MAGKAWSGDLRKVPFPEVLATLNREQACGTLYCVRNSTTRMVHVAEGTPYWASSSDPDDSARAWLFRRGRINTTATPGQGTGQSSEFLEDVETRQLIEHHALELVLDLFSWGDGAYIFQPFDAPHTTLLRFDVSFDSLVSQGLKRVKRVSAVRTGAGAPDGWVVPVTDIDTSRVLGLDEDTCLVLGEITSGGQGELPVDGWPCDYRVLLCVWELKLMGLALATGPLQGVEVRRLLRGSSRTFGATEEHARPEVFDPPRLRTGQVGASAAPPPLTVRNAPAARPPAPAPAAPRARPELPDPALELSAETFAPAPVKLPPVASRVADPATAGAPRPPAQAPPPPARPEPPPRQVAPTSPADVLTRAPTAERKPVLASTQLTAAPTARPAGHAPVPPAAVVHAPTAAPENGDLSLWNGARNPKIAGLDSEDLQAASSPAAATTAVEWFKTGERFARELDFHNAITSYREAVALEPNNLEYRLRLGAVLARNPKWRKEAEDHLLKAAEIEPWNAKCQLALGRMYLDAGLPKRAEPRLKAALEAEPTNPAVLKEMKRLGAKPGKSGEGLLDRLSKLGKTGESKGEAAKAPAEEADTEIVL